MKLKHIALNILDKTDLTKFYQNILGFHLVHQFELNASYGQQIFAIEKQTEVFIYSNDQIDFELFVLPEQTQLGFAHICVDLEDCDLVAEKCKKAGYPVVRIERENNTDLLFIMDKAGNKFELKNR